MRNGGAPGLGGTVLLKALQEPQRGHEAGFGDTRPAGGEVEMERQKIELLRRLLLIFADGPARERGGDGVEFTVQVFGRHG